MKKKALVVVLLCVMGLAALSINNAEAGAMVYLYGLTSWRYHLGLFSYTIRYGCPPKQRFSRQHSVPDYDCR